MAQKDSSCKVIISDYNKSKITQLNILIKKYNGTVIDKNEKAKSTEFIVVFKNFETGSEFIKEVPIEWSENKEA